MGRTRTLFKTFQDCKQRFSTKLANDWIRTADLWYRKRPFYQLLLKFILTFHKYKYLKLTYLKSFKLHFTAAKLKTRISFGLFLKHSWIHSHVPLFLCVCLFVPFFIYFSTYHPNLTKINCPIVDLRPSTWILNFDSCPTHDFFVFFKCQTFQRHNCNITWGPCRAMPGQEEGMPMVNGERFLLGANACLVWQTDPSITAYLIG